MLVSVHIPKCAGTSFRHVLHSLYGDRAWDNYGAVFTRGEARPGIVPAGTVCVHGHFLADAFDDVCPERELITWLRHPVERVVSNYFHFLRAPDMRDDCCRALHERKLSLLEFADLEWMRNESSRYLAGKPIDDFGFVGIVEHFSESLRHFSGRFGRGRSLPEPMDNVNPWRKAPNYALSHGEYAHILVRNALDVRLYQQALDRLGMAPPLVATGTD